VNELEPTLVAVPGPLIIPFKLGYLSIGVEYLEENLVGKIVDRCTWKYLIVGVMLPFRKLIEDVWIAYSM
jgi:hypothetical protein